MLVADSITQVLVDPGSLRAYLKAHYGRQDGDTSSSWQRMETALAHRGPDLIPFDFRAVPEVWVELRAALAARDDDEILQLLGIVCAIMDRFTDLYIANTGRVIEAARGLLGMV